MSSKSVGKVHVSLGLNSTKFRNGLRRASAKMTAFSRRAGAAMGLASVAVASGMALMTRSGLQFVDQQAKLARTLDASINGLRALQIAGEDAGVPLGTLGKSLQMMNGRLAEAARRGGPAADMLKTMGLNAADLLEMDVDERLAVIADRAKDLGWSAAQAGDFLTQMGIRSREMANLVIQGGDAIRDARQEVRDFGLTISRDQAAAVERANDAMSRMKLVFEGLRVQLAVRLAPTLELVARRWQEMSKTGGPLQLAVQNLSASFASLIEKLASPEFIEMAVKIGTGLVGALNLAVDAMKLLTDHADLAAGAMVVLGTSMAFFGGPIIGTITALAGAFYLLSGRTGQSAAAAALSKQAHDELAVALGGVRDATPGATANALALTNQLIDEARASLSAAEAYLVYLESIQSRAGDGPLSAVNAWLAGKVTPEYVERIASLRTELDGLGRTAQGLVLSEFGGGADGGPAEIPEVFDFDAAREEFEEFAQSIDPAIERLENFTSASEFLQLSLDRGVISQEEYARNLELVKQAYGEIETSAGGAAAAINEVTEETSAFESGITGAVQTAAQAFGDWIGRGFKDFNGFLKSAFSGFKKLLIDMAVLAAKNKISILLGVGGSGVGGAASAATGGGGLLAGALGSFASTGAAGSGLLGGLGAALGVGGAAGGGIFGIGASAAAAGGGLMATIGAAMPIIGIGLALFSLFKRKPAISKADFASIQSGLELTGMALLGTGKAGKKAAASLKKAAGGIKEFQSQSQFYFDNFFSGAEKRAKAMESLDGVFGRLGMQIPQTAQQFKEIVEGLDLTTSAGRNAYSELLKVAPVFTSVFGSIADAGRALNSAFGDDLFATREQMQRGIAAIQRGGQIYLRPTGSGVINLGEILTVSERAEKLQAETAMAGISTAGSTAQMVHLLKRWDIDGMPPEQTA